MIRVMDDLGGLSMSQRHVQRVQDQLRAQVPGHRPAHDAPTPHIEHHARYRNPPTSVRSDIATTADSAGRGEVPLDQSGAPPRPRPAPWSSPTSSGSRRAARPAHQPRHPLATNRSILGDELGVDPGSTIGAARRGVDPAICCRNTAPHRRAPTETRPPRVVPAGGDPQHAAHRGYPMLGLVYLHELEDSDPLESVSRANQPRLFSRSPLFAQRLVLAAEFLISPAPPW